MASSAAFKKRRAVRARAKQRPRGHDIRDQYRTGDLPTTSRIGVLTIEDPYSEAARVPEGLSMSAPGWNKLNTTTAQLPKAGRAGPHPAGLSSP